MKLKTLLLLAAILPFTCVIADDLGADEVPSEYAAEEATVSSHNYGRTLCDNPDYFCRPVTERDTWFSLFPDFQQREEVMRLNRTNVALMYRNWIVVPKDFSKTSYMDMSPLPAHMDTQGKNEVVISLGKFAFGAYDTTGQLIYWGPISSGEMLCPASDTTCKTAMGKFKVFRIGGEDCYSKQYPLETEGGAPMPYCMFFHNGMAFHTSTLSGFINRSGGCVRMFDADAQWLNQVFVKLGTTVIVEE